MAAPMSLLNELGFIAGITLVDRGLRKRNRTILRREFSMTPALIRRGGVAGLMHGV